MSEKLDFYFEVTDTYGGEANYCWVNRIKISAKNLHGALIKLSKHTGLHFRSDGLRYNAKGAAICAFLLNDDYDLESHYKFYRIF